MILYLNFFGYRLDHWMFCYIYVIMSSFVIYVVPDPTHIKEILDLYRVVKRKSHLQVMDIYPFGMLMKLKQKVTLTFSSVRN